MFISYIICFLLFFFFPSPFSSPYKALPPETRCYCLVVTHHSMEHPVLPFLEPTKTWKLTCISRRNFWVASCLTQVLHLQEQVLPLREISNASLPRVNLQQSQRSAPHPVLSSTLKLAQGDSSSHCTLTVAGHCCSAGGRGQCTISAATQTHWKKKGYSACHSDV